MISNTPIIVILVNFLNFFSRAIGFQDRCCAGSGGPGIPVSPEIAENAAYGRWRGFRFRHHVFAWLSRIDCFFGLNVGRTSYSPQLFKVPMFRTRSGKKLDLADETV